MWDKYQGVWIPACEANYLTLQVGNEPEHTNHTFHIPPKKEEKKKPSVEARIIQGTADTSIVFGVGDLVFIEPHSWPGKNCEGGVAKVVSTEVDEDGDRVYKVKYVIGSTKGGIEAQFVHRHNFDD